MEPKSLGAELLRYFWNNIPPLDMNLLLPRSINKAPTDQRTEGLRLKGLHLERAKAWLGLRTVGLTPGRSSSIWSGCQYRLRGGGKTGTWDHSGNKIWDECSKHPGTPRRGLACCRWGRSRQQPLNTVKEITVSQLP